jgi:hypothetical protein
MGHNPLINRRGFLAALAGVAAPLGRLAYSYSVRVITVGQTADGWAVKNVVGPVVKSLVWVKK